MQQYLDLVRHTLEYGEDTPTRTGVNARTVFGEMMQFDLARGFPILTTKKVLWDTVVDETLWFLRGGHNVNDPDAPKKIWDSWRAPYNLNRGFVLVERRIREYQPLVVKDFRPDCSVGTDKESLIFKLAQTWRDMMRRCYDSSTKGYDNYASKGVSVCERWQSFSKFFQDAQSLPHWWYKEHKWDTFELDKDYYGANQYGPETCVWVHYKENCWYSAQACPVEVVTVGGESLVFLSLSAAAAHLGVSNATMTSWFRYGSARGKVRGPNCDLEGYVFNALPKSSLLRLPLLEDGEMGSIYGKTWRAWDTGVGYIDQLQIAIDRVKNEPNSRRNIVSAWNVGDVDNMALPPCHMSFQFRRFGNYLDLAMYQRSADLALGVPMNIASYALLLSMVAHECGLTARRFVHFLADCHIYENHLAGLKTQLGRIPGVLPTLRFSCPIGTPVVEMTKDMIHLDNYNPQPFIKFEVAV